MSFDIDAAFDQALQTAGNAFGGAWDEVKPIFNVEFKTTLGHFKEIGQGLVSGDLNPATAETLVKMQVNNLVMAIAAATTITLAAAQAAINAVIGAITGLFSDALNAIIPF